MVRKEDRGEGKFDVFVDAKKLSSYTIQIASNQKVFKPEYRTYLTDEIVKDARNIFAYAWAANNIRVKSKEDWDRRKNLQNRAIANCESLIVNIQIAKPVYHLRTKRVKYWGEWVLRVRSKLKAWKESDTKRYGKL